MNSQKDSPELTPEQIVEAIFIQGAESRGERPNGEELLQLREELAPVFVQAMDTLGFEIVSKA